MKKFITNLGVIPSILDHMLLFLDNNFVIAQKIEPKFHQNSKHILSRFHLIREIIVRGDIVVERVLSTDNSVYFLPYPKSFMSLIQTNDYIYIW